MERGITLELEDREISSSLDNQPWHWPKGEKLPLLTLSNRLDMRLKKPGHNGALPRLINEDLK